MAQNPNTVNGIKSRIAEVFKKNGMDSLHGWALLYNVASDRELMRKMEMHVCEDTHYFLSLTTIPKISPHETRLH